MRRRRPDDFENPAWPGLVDVFAFTLVLVILIWGGSDPERWNQLEKENLSLAQENADLKKELENLRGELEGLKKIIATRGKIILDSISSGLSKEVDQEGVEVRTNSEGPEIAISFKPPIAFKTAQFDLSMEDETRLRHLAPVLLEQIKGKPVVILINGTADPRHLKGKGLPPRNNRELSALRAATVAAKLVDAAPELGKKIRVVGLGEVGELKDPPPPDPEIYYEKFRTVTLVIRVGEAILTQGLEGGR